MFTLSLIFFNDTVGLKTGGLLKGDLNFAVPFPELEIDDKVTPLVLASYLGRNEIVSLMIEQNRDLDLDLPSRDSGFTPLMMACKTANYDVVKILLEHGAEPNIPNAFNQVALSFCFARLDESENTYENNKIAFLMADLIIQHGGDVNWIIDKQRGYTFLMQYCSIKHELSDHDRDINVQVIKFLLERGASTHLPSLKKNKTVLAIAEKHFNRERVLHLLNSVKPMFTQRGAYCLNLASEKKKKPAFPPVAPSPSNKSRSGNVQSDPLSPHFKGWEAAPASAGKEPQHGGHLPNSKSMPFFTSKNKINSSGISTNDHSTVKKSGFSKQN